MKSLSSDLLFLVAGTLAFVGAAATVIATKPLRATIALLVHILALAGLYLTLRAQLLAVIQMLVYAGAIVVLFVFVIMLIGPDAEQRGSRTRVFGSLFGLVFMGTFAMTIAVAIAEYSPVLGPVDDTYGTLEGVGRELYGSSWVPFEIASVTLLVAIIGAVAVARGRTEKEAAEVRQVKAEREAVATARRAEDAASVANGSGAGDAS